MDHSDLVQFPTTHMDDNQHEMMRAAVVSSLDQAAASQSHDARGHSDGSGHRGVGLGGGAGTGTGAGAGTGGNGGGEGGELEIGGLPLDLEFGSGGTVGGTGDEDERIGDITGDSIDTGEQVEGGGGGDDVGDNGGNGHEEHDSTSPSSINKRRSTNGLTSSTPKRAKGNPGVGTPMTEEEKKVKLREANRKAAERSRGKKRGELHALEETVRNIQEENARLRTQLESLLSIATSSTNTNPESGGQSQSTDPTFSSGGGNDDVIGGVVVPGDVDSPYGGMPMTGMLGELGLDIPLLSNLHRQIITLRASIAERERVLDPTIAAATAGTTTTTTTTTSSQSTTTTTTDKQLRSERTALISLIAHLKEEREKIDRENALLEREIKQKRMMNGGVDGVATTSQDYEKKEGDDSVAVERALIEIRSWLDEALKGWQDTGLLKRPPTTTLPTRDSGGQGHPIPTSNPTDEFHPDFSFQAEDLTPEQVNQYAQAYATSMGGGTTSTQDTEHGQGQSQGQGHMNLLSEVSMTQGR